MSEEKITRWLTVKDLYIPIRSGQSKEEAFQEYVCWAKTATRADKNRRQNTGRKWFAAQRKIAKRTSTKATEKPSLKRDEKQNPERPRSIESALESAVYYVGGDARTIPSHEQWHGERVARVAAEEKRLKEWAESFGKLGGRLPKEQKRGGEHIVEGDETRQRVLKATQPHMQLGYGIAYGSYSQGATPGEYLDRLLLTNAIFDDDIRLERVVLWSGRPSIVTSQPFIRGVEATQEEIDDYMATKGFEKLRTATYYHQGEGILAHDLYPKNALKDVAGRILPIDPVIQRVEPEFADFIRHNPVFLV